MKEKTKKEIGFTENYTNKREQYLNLRINNECVWVTKLRSILNSDIHEKPLGCKISNTHIRIGKVHLDTFYEAQILFSHAHWVQRFANELSHKITDSILQKKRIVLVGYETYIEPVMYLLKEVIKKKYRELDVEYCIFEEEKYTYLQNVKAPEIRYIETAFKKGDTEDILKATQIVFICGISTTLSTYARMLDQVKTDLSNKIYNDEIADKDEKRLKALFNTNVESKDKNPTQNAIQYFSIIQVLPNNLESDKCKFVINDKDDFKEILTWDDSKKWVNRRTIVKTVEKTIDVPYIVDVKCGWYNASDCKMCYPDDILKEKPIIQTSETSVVPIQRILLNKRNKHNDASDTIKVNSIDFFEKDKEGNFIFRDYLYYGHTVRGEHHFLYYIRTNHLFADIISDNIPKCVGPFGEENFNALKKFKDYCNQAKKNIEERLNKNKCSVDDAIHIIISPSHFSSKMFCNAINQYVFKYKAHVISFDPQKEYRSSFETKYSNYAYFLEQTKEIFEDRRVSKKKLFFYFVDDQIITGSNFYRMTSLIKNLFVQTENIKIWNGVFVIVNRNSNSTKMDYTDLNGLLGIFGNYIKKEKNLTEEGYVSRCTIRASQLRFLNDSQEYLNGQKKYIQYYSRTFTKLIDSYLQLQSNLNKNSGPSKLFKPLKNISIIGNAETKSKKIDDSNQDIFSISFCGKGDLLSQWKYYGKNSGIAIEFNLENSFYCLGNLKKDARLDESLKDLPMIAPLKIAYSEKDKKRMFIRSCFTIGNDGEPIIQNPAKEIFIPFCKNKDFMEEDESRLIFFLGDNIYVNEIDPPLIDYVVSDNKIKPFIPVTLIKKQNNKIGSENNIIKSLTVGPGVNQNLIYNALIHIFDANKFSFECEKSGKHECKSGVIIKKSNIPFRG